MEARMIPVEAIYDGRFFRTRHKLSWRAPIICRSIWELFTPVTLIDVGCAIGDLVEGFLKLGVNAFGLEGSEAVTPYLVCMKERVVIHDLRYELRSLPIGFPENFDVVVCFETAEHVDPEYSDIFILNLQALAKRWIIMSAAPPGQLGKGHVNCQPSQYWISKMKGHGFMCRFDLESQLKREWEAVKSKDGVRAFYNNLLVFERKDGVYVQ